MKDVIYVRDASLGTFDDPIGIFTFQFYFNLSAFSRQNDTIPHFRNVLIRMQTASTSRINTRHIILFKNEATVYDR